MIDGKAMTRWNGITLVKREERTAVVNPIEVLRELFDLLEDYSPGWYPEEMHNRAVSALVQHSQQI